MILVLLSASMWHMFNYLLGLDTGITAYSFSSHAKKKGKKKKKGYE